MSDLKLYAIELDSKKVFLHVSLPIKEQLLFQECTILFDFVKKYPPIRVLNEIDLEDVLIVDYYVKYFMRHYGIDNVRGGNYTDEVLSNDVLTRLKMEIGKTSADYERDNELYEYLVLYYKMIDLDRLKEIEKLNNQLEIYKAKQELVGLFSTDKNIIADLEWLTDEIKNKRDIYDLPVDTIQKLYKVIYKTPSILSLKKNGEFDYYNNVMIKIVDLIDKYALLTSDFSENIPCVGVRNRIHSIIENKIEITTLLKYPRFTFDNIILHPHIINNWSSYTENSLELIDKITTMAYTLINFLDELNYDLSILPEYFEKKTRYSILFLESRK